MIVSEKTFSKAMEELIQSAKEHRFLALDTETTGLNLWKEDRLFSVIFHSEKGGYYFNFQNYNDESPVLNRIRMTSFQDIFDIEDLTIFIHNAKFDMAALNREGLTFPCNIHCTEVVDRLIYNEHKSYSLNSCVERWFNEKKDDSVMAYIVANKLYEKSEDRKNDKYFFDKVPFSIISEYALKDAELCYRLGKKQLEKLEELHTKYGTAARSLKRVYELEKQVTKVLFQMEKRGVKIDVGYCEKAYEYEKNRTDKIRGQIEAEIGTEFIDSGKALGEVFSKRGVRLPVKKETGNIQVDSYVLEGIKDPLAKLILDIRDSYKRGNTYFKNFLELADYTNVIHANARQSGTKTGRLSYWDPNLQNLTKEDDSPFPIRRAFIPREGHYFLSRDYNQMEFRLLLEYSEEHRLIKKILDGYDPHDASAELTNLNRKAAKTFNFAMVYGVGIDKLSTMLGSSKYSAIDMKKKYFNNLPKVEQFLWGTRSVAKNRGFVFDWLGRIFWYPDHNVAYRAANSIIQGGCADVVKKAMVSLGEDSPLSIQIHDELIFEVPNDYDTSSFKEKMETAYPYRYLPLTTSSSRSRISLGDLIEDEKEGNNIQGASIA